MTTRQTVHGGLDEAEPEHIRIAVRCPEECARLIESLREALEHE